MINAGVAALTSQMRARLAEADAAKARANWANVVVNTDAVELLRSVGDGAAGAVMADPPFFISIGRAAGWHEKRGLGVDPWTTAGDGTNTVSDMVEWYALLAKQVHRVLRPGGASVIMGGAHSISAWEVAAARAGLTWMAELMVLWNAGKPRARNFGSLTTTIRWHIKPGHRHTFNAGKQRSIYSNVLICTKVALANKVHSAQKPVELTNFLVSLLTRDDDLIIDPFCGSGSTLVSAEMCNRRWLGGDTDKAMCQVAATRTMRLELEEANLRPLYFWINGSAYEVEAAED